MPLRLLVFGSALLFTVACGEPSSVELPPVVTGSVGGRVAVSGTGGVGGVTVTIEGERSLSLETGSLGEYSFEGLAVGAYTVEISGFSSAIAFDDTVKSTAVPDGGGDVVVDFQGAWPQVEIEPAILLGGVVGTTYDAPLSVSGGDGTYAWSTSTGAVPDGVTLSEMTGLLAGTPTRSATFDFTVSVVSGDGQSDERALSISIFDALWLDLGGLPDVVVGGGYDQALVATGGDGSFGWSMPSGSLPAGLLFDPSAATIRGSAAEVGLAQFTVRVESGDGQSVEVAASIAVWGELQIETVSLPNGVEGTAMGIQLSAVGGDGSYSWSVTAGALPAGVTLGASTGELSGAPTQSGTFNFTVAAESGDGQVVARAMSMSTFEPLTLDVSSLTDVTIGDGYDQDLVATGGDGSLTWSIVTGALPGGLLLDSSTGTVAGVTTEAGPTQFTVRVESGDGQVVDVVASIAVWNVLQIETIDLGEGQLEVDFGRSVAAVGGSGPYDWTVSSGLLPAGLSLLAATGSIQGAPTALGTFNFSVSVASGDGQGASQSYSVRVVLGPESLCANFPGSAVVTFADGVISAAVRQALGFGDQDDMTCGDVLPMTSLGSVSGVQSLSGLQNLPNLTDLLASGGSIADLAPIAGLTALETLVLSDNAISDLGPLSGMTSLTYFDATSNAISDLSPIGGNSGLASLRVSVNLLTDLSGISSFPSLTLLMAKSNRLTSVAGVSALSLLRDVFLGDNMITDITPFTGLTEIFRLRLDVNLIEDITPLATLTGLRNIGLGENRVTDLSPVVGLPILTWLSVPDNGLTDISPLSTMTDLTFVNLQDNALTDISATEFLTSLDDIVLSGNPDLTNIQPLLDNVAMDASVRVFLFRTAVSCTDVAALEALGVVVPSDCS